MGLFNRKGSVMDLFLIMILGFSFIVFAVSMIYVSNITHTELLDFASDHNDKTGDDFTTQIDSSVGKVSSGLKMFEWITTIFIFGMFISMLVSSYMVRTNKIFLVVYFLILICSVVVAMEFSNMYEAVQENNELTSTFLTFKGSNYIYSNLAVFVLIFGALGGIIIFSNAIRGDQYV